MKRILCYGDSNTWGYEGGTANRYPDNVRWTGLLKEATGHTIIEEGLNGRTTVFDDALTPGANGLTYLLPCLKSHAPLDMVIFSLGTNDLKINVCGRAGGSAMGMAQLVDKTRQVLGDVKILIISPICIGEGRRQQGPLIILPPDCYEQSRQFAAYYKPVAEQYGCYFLDAQQIAQPGSADFVHMAPDGHKALAKAVAKVVEEVL